MEFLIKAGEILQWTTHSHLMNCIPLRMPVPEERCLQRTQSLREDNGFTGSSGACSDVLILWLLLGFAHGFGSDSWLGAGALAWLTLWLLVLNTGCDPRINTCSNLIRTPDLLFYPGFLAPGCFSNASSQTWTVVQTCMGKSFNKPWRTTQIGWMNKIISIQPFWQRH